MELLDKIFDEYIYPSHPYVNGYTHIFMDPRDHRGRGYDKIVVYVDMEEIDIPSEITPEMIGYDAFEMLSFDEHISIYLDHIKSDISLTIVKYLKYIGMDRVVIDVMWESL